MNRFGRNEHEVDIEQKKRGLGGMKGCGNGGFTDFLKVGGGGEHAWVILGGERASRGRAWSG